MSKYFVVKPEVAGGFGDGTVVVDPSARPPLLRRFHYRFDGWLGDELVTTVACFIVTRSLANSFLAGQLSGFNLGDVEVTKSEEFERRSPKLVLPSFIWLQIDGRPGQDDFGISAELKYRLVVSEMALSILKKHSINHCEILPY